MKFYQGAIMVFAFLLLFILPRANAETHSVFYFSTNCIEAQKHIASLRLNKATQLLATEKKAHPNNAAIAFLENYIDYYRILTSQDFSLIKSMEQYKTARFNLVKSIPESSPYRLYAQSEMHLQYAFVKVFNEEYMSAMLEFRNAYKYAVENQKKFPQFKQNLKTVGMFKALLGTTPNNYKWMLSVAGLDGNYIEGMAQLKTYLASKPGDEQTLDEQSAVFYYSLFHLNFGDKDVAWDVCVKNTSDYTTNLMSCYLRTFIGYKIGQTNDAITVLENRPKQADYESFIALEYYLGICKLNRLDDDADIHFKQFVTYFKGRLFMKDAYRRLYWFYLLRNENEKAQAYKLMGKKYGVTKNEEEKNVQREVDQGLAPDLILLKARLLCDGGYYAKAEEAIKQRKESELKTDYLKLEYHYRYGRILQEQNKWSKATEYFGYVIKNAPENTPYFFAPNACLQMGFIYKKLGFNQIAKSHFSAVKKYSKAEYISSFEIRAEKELENL